MIIIIVLLTIHIFLFVLITSSVSLYCVIQVTQSCHRHKRHSQKKISHDVVVVTPPVIRQITSSYHNDGVVSVAVVTYITAIPYCVSYAGLITFRVRRSRGEMYIDHARLCVCPSLAAFPHYCTDLDVTCGNSRGCPLVVHHWADLQSVHGFRCYDNIAPNARCQRVLVFALCLVSSRRSGQTFVLQPHRLGLWTPW